MFNKKIMKDNFKDNVIFSCLNGLILSIIGMSLYNILSIIETGHKVIIATGDNATNLFFMLGLFIINIFLNGLATFITLSGYQSVNDF